VESDEVLLIFQPLGTQSNSATQKYMNAKKVPQLFVATGATKWVIPRTFRGPWAGSPTTRAKGRIYAAYILKNYPNGKIAAIWQNDDAGKDQMKGLRDGLGAKAGMIISDKSYEVSDPTLDSQIVALRDSGADIFMTWAAPKGAAQAIRKVGELGWKPVFFLGNVSTSVATVLKPAGLDNSKGIISTAYFKDPTDPLWKDDPGLKTWALSWTSISRTATRPTTTTSMAIATHSQKLRYNRHDSPSALRLCPAYRGNLALASRVSRRPSEEDIRSEEANNGSRMRAHDRLRGHLEGMGRNTDV